MSAETDQRHGRVDADASERLDELVAMARAAGFNTSAGLLVSNAIRILHLLASGEATLVAPDGLDLLSETAGDGPEIRLH